MLQSTTQQEVIIHYSLFTENLYNFIRIYYMREKVKNHSLVTNVTA